VREIKGMLPPLFRVLRSEEGMILRES